MLGIGVLFLSLYKGYADEAFSILFGEILGISLNSVLLTLIVSVPIMVAIAIVYRPLLFASLDEDVAEAKGMSMLLIGIIFMLLVAVATSIAVQVVGVLLIFALMVTPAAIAQRLTTKPIRAIIVSVAVALLATWLGLFIAFYEPYPVSFFITSIVFILYLFIRFVYPKLKPLKNTQIEKPHVETDSQLVDSK
jgi:zinc/manganese transport system permease protein